MNTLPDYFSLYGIEPTLTPDAAAVRRRFYELSRTHHPDRAGTGAAAQIQALQMTTDINDGQKVLSDPDALLGYVLRREGVVEEGESYALPAGFLMEMMELNEAVGNVAMDPTLRPEAMREAEAASAAWERELTPLRDRFNAGEREAELLSGLKDLYYRGRYLSRLRSALDKA